MTRVFSGIQPTGQMHLGNYLGAIKNWILDQADYESFFCLVDLHAITLEHDPKKLRKNTLDAVISLLSAGLDPNICTLFIQSHVSYHSELSWLLECNTQFGELSRMTQFKDKSTSNKSITAGLFTYPVLMSADILAYKAQRVPVGQDQVQHLELARNIAIRFNHKYGDTFVVPQAHVPKVGAKIMDLQIPTKKMSKSTSSDLGAINLLDSPQEISKKIKKAVTDTSNEVYYDIEKKPGVSNLLSILSACTSIEISKLQDNYSQYGPLKKDTAEAVIQVLEPIQKRYKELQSDLAEVEKILKLGAQKASSVASVTIKEAKEAMGFLILSQP